MSWMYLPKFDNTWQDFKIWRWKFKVKVMGEVNVDESHNVSPTFSRLTSLSFHVNGASHSWVMTSSKFEWDHSSNTCKSQCGSNILATHPFHSRSFGPPIPDRKHFQNLTLKIQCQSQMTMMLNNCSFRQLHRTSKGIYSSSGFRDMGSAMYGPSVAWFEKFLTHGQAQMGKWIWRCTTTGLEKSMKHYTGYIHSALSEICILQSLAPICGKFDKFLAHGQVHMGQMAMTVHNYRPRHFHKTWNRENLSSGYIDMDSASLAAARPAAHPPAAAHPDPDDNNPPARRAEE